VPTVPTDIEKWTSKIEEIGDALASLPLDELARSLIATVDAECVADGPSLRVTRCDPSRRCDTVAQARHPT